ncbi:MAG: ComF family protein [Hyphomicrobiaceae bacterium]
MSWPNCGFETTKTHNSLCAGCWLDIRFITHPLCDRLGIPLPFDPGGGPILSAAALAKETDFERTRVVAHYSGVMRKLIHLFKYADQHAPAQLFTAWIEHAASELISDATVIVPVPLHYTRLLSRRFNQSAIIARRLAVRTDRPVVVDALVRRRKTASQVGLTRDQRRRNLRGAFAVRDSGVPGIKDQNVLLIDDVITTGTTVEACARSLKRCGARRIDVAALALVSDEARINL